MPTTREREEASQISAVFHASLVQMGIDTTLDAFELWQDVQVAPARMSASVGRFLARLLSLTTGRRSSARDLALSYVRLHRALHTGYTYGQEGTSTTLAALRDDFYSQVEEATPGLLEPDGSLVDTDGVEVAGAPERYTHEVKVESLEPLDDNELDEIAEQELEAQVGNSAVRSLARNAPSEDAPAKDVDAKRDQIHANAGALAAGAAQRAVVNAGREQVDGIAKKDTRAIGYVRVSGTGTPCGWCAMLISRGPVYRSKQSGTSQEDGTQYHANCACFCEPVYSAEQYENDPRFDLNRELSADWARETRGSRGDAALSRFRKFIRSKYRDTPGG